MTRGGGGSRGLWMEWRFKGYWLHFSDPDATFIFETALGVLPRHTERTACSVHTTSNSTALFHNDVNVHTKVEVDQTELLTVAMKKRTELLQSFSQ